ncbi:MAG: dicarboxylate transporter-DctM subunit [Ramlibacter sp.]|jgi:tripartite ATP-independent transporter DctM subunit|nr:dicarboxylate transporter-DctM subunit [Ramlibacter sp.]
MSISLLLIFLALSALGVPLAISLGLAGVASIAIFTATPITLLSESMFSAMNSFLLVAVPLFLLVGQLMERGGVADRIFDFAHALVGWLPGGMGHVNVASSVVFGGISGSSVADIASLGAVEINAMVKHGYDKGYAVGMTLTTSTLSSIIPPSILMVIAGSIASQSIGLLLVAGLIPGLFIAAMLMVYNHIYSVRRGVCKPTPFRWGHLARAGVRAILPILTPVILMVGILDGFFTPTEAAAIAVVYTFGVAALVYRQIAWKDIAPMLIETARTSGNILFIAATAKLAAWVFAYDGLPVKVGELLASITTSPTLIMALMFIFLVVVGMFMDAIAAMFILIPVLLPPAVALGVDPIHMLVIVVITLTLGLVTPPVGVCLFAVAKVANMSLEEVIKGAVGPVSVLVLAIVALVLFPVLVIGPLRLFGMY